MRARLAAAVTVFAVALATPTAVAADDLADATPPGANQQVLPPSGDGAGNEDTTSDDDTDLRARERSFLAGEGKAGDTRGVMKSLYQGKWFVEKHESIRRCIVRRESDGNYKVVSAGGLYRGAYQMNRSLALGATHQMLDEVVEEFGPEAADIVRQLRDMPTQQWNRYWQDRAFWTVWRKGKGAFHWRGMHC